MKHHYSPSRLLSALLLSAVATGAAAQSAVVSFRGHTFDVNDVERIEFCDSAAMPPASAELSDGLAALVAQAGNLKIMSRLLVETGWAEKIRGGIDRQYDPTLYAGMEKVSGLADPVNIPAVRRTGHTLFLEPDEVLAQAWGVTPKLDADGRITNWSDVLVVVKGRAEEAYGSGSSALTDETNPVNRFVAAHIVPGAMRYDRLVVHYNEYNYNFGNNRTRPQTYNCPTNVWDYYATAGACPRLLKVTQVGDQGFENDRDHKIYLNRISFYDNSRNGDYRELGVEERGILVSAYNGEWPNVTDAGAYYIIDRPLLFNETTNTWLASERIRADFTTLLPDFISSGLRHGEWSYLPADFVSNVKVSESTMLNYLHAGSARSSGYYWANYQGDELYVTGNFNITLPLPPVPKDGIYEVRLGTSHNASRNIVQMFFSEDGVNFMPVGGTYDQTEPAGTDNIPWVADTGNDLTDAGNDRRLRSKGFMKAPKYFCMTGSTTSVRDWGGSYPALRRIVGEFPMKAGKNYYLRFKALRTAESVASSALFLDYVELCPASVYNGLMGEDIW